jgi:hypothetical protein
VRWHTDRAACHLRVFAPRCFLSLGGSSIQVPTGDLRVCTNQVEWVLEALFKHGPNGYVAHRSKAVHAMLIRRPRTSRTPENADG